MFDSDPPVGDVPCADLNKRRSVCRIVVVAGTKFIERYSEYFAGGEDIYKYYITYHDNVRYQMSPGSYLLGNDPDEPKFIGTENIDWVYRKMFPESKF